MFNATDTMAIFNKSPIPQLVLLPDLPHNTIVGVNQAYLQATNTTKSDLIGRAVFEAFPANPGEIDGDFGIKNLKASLKQVIEQKQPHKMDPVKYDIPVRNTEGFQERYWHPVNYPILNENGEIDFIIHTPTDITEKIQAEKISKAAREKLREETHIRQDAQQQLLEEKTFGDSLIKSLPGIFFLYDDQGKMHRWNDNMEDITGYTSDEIIQMHPLMFIPDEQVKIVRDLFDETFFKGKAEAEASLITKDGRKIPFLFTTMIIKTDEKDYIIGTGSDITELVKERSARMRLSQIVEESKNEIYIIDEATRLILYANSGARVNLGYSIKELKKMSPMDVIGEDNPQKIEQYARQLLDHNKDKVTFKTLHRRAGGDLYHVEAHMQLIEQEGQKVFIVIAMDISERVQIDAQVKASLQEKEVLLNEIHHRVKNNLAIVSSLLHLQSQTIKDKEVKDLLAESEGRIQSMALIHELLYKQDNFSNIEFGAYLNKLLQHISSNYQSQGTVITTEVKSDAVFLKIDTAIPCALICHELINNAYKHAFTGRASGKISLSLNHSKGMISIVVSDNGIGLHTQGKRSTLGLTLIHGLAKQLKGTITSEIENGTAFTLSFPAVCSKTKLADNPIQKVG